ncbi:structural protein [Vibrio phage K250 g1]
MAKDKIAYIMERVNDQLMDDGFTRWPKDELINYFNTAQRAVVISRPDASVVELEDFDCVAGTKQTLPEDGLRLVDVRSMTTGAIRSRTRSEMSDLYPDWLATTGSSYAEGLIYDEREPKRFFLFPGVAVGTKVELVYSATPPLRVEADIDAGDTDLDNIYTPPVIEYMLYMAHSKDFEYSEIQKAQMHLAMFNNILGIKSQSDAAMTPTDKD